MIEQIFIKAANRVDFEAKLNAGQVNQTSIAFILDTKEIWTHGRYFTCPTTLSQLDTDSTHRLVTDALINIWNAKQDAISDLDGIRRGAYAGATAYQKPTNGIPVSDLDNSVIDSFYNGLGSSAFKNYTNNYSSTGENPITGKGVAEALDTLPSPMVFKGSLGISGTIKMLPADGSATVGDTYKVITPGTFAGQSAKPGDVFICNRKMANANEWVLIPSGDEPSGTVTSITLSATSPINIDNNSAITTSGTRVISHATSGATAGSYGDSTNQTPNFGATFNVPYITINNTGHITALSSHSVKVPNASITNGTITIGSNSITPLTESSTLNASKLNDWSLDQILPTGSISSDIGSLSSYWGKVWEATINNKRFNNQDIIFLVSAPMYLPEYGFIKVNIRQNGIDYSGNYLFDCILEELVGNIKPNNVRLYYDNTTGVCSLWLNTEYMYKCYTVSILKKSGRLGKDVKLIGELYSTWYTLAQTLPTCNYITMTLSYLYNNADTATKLRTPRKLWGQPFDGQYDISGDISGVNEIFINYGLRINGCYISTLEEALNNREHINNVVEMDDQHDSYVKGLYIENQVNIGEGLSLDWPILTINDGLIYWDFIDNAFILYDLHDEARSYASLFCNVVYCYSSSTFSDASKKDIIDFDVLPTTEQVADAPAIRFRWKDKPQDGESIGTIAQYWQNILPEAVLTNRDGVLSMQYGTVALLSTISNARKIIEIENRLTQLEQKIIDQ